METLSQLPSHVSTWWMYLSSHPAIEFALAHLSPADVLLAVAGLLVLAAVVRLTRQRAPIGGA